MTLNEMSAQYRQSGESCRARMRELAARLRTEELCETERINLRRRVCVLDAMARDAIAISRYLANYYGGGARR